MLSKLIVTSYKILIEIAMWLILLIGFIGGWSQKGFLGAIGGLIVAFIFCVVFFGAFLVILDIQKSVKAIEQRSGTST